MTQIPFLDKAHEAITAAELLLNAKCFSSAANRAYYAAFHAARAALVAAGVAATDHRWSHEGIQGAFSQLVRRRKIYSAQRLADLALLQSVRGVADYRVEMVSSRVAHDVVKMARMFVGAVEKETLR